MWVIDIVLIPSIKTITIKKIAGLTANNPPKIKGCRYEHNDKLADSKTFTLLIFVFVFSEKKCIDKSDVQ